MWSEHEFLAVGSLQVVRDGAGRYRVCTDPSSIILSILGNPDLHDQPAKHHPSQIEKN